MSIKLQMFSGGPARGAMAGYPFPRAPGAAAVGLIPPSTPGAAKPSPPGAKNLQVQPGDWREVRGGTEQASPGVAPASGEGTIARCQGRVLGSNFWRGL